MPVPVTTEQLLALVRKSNLIAPERLEETLKTFPPVKEHSEPVKYLAKLLVEAGLLTRFQAEQMLQGKWRGFSIGKFKVLERLGAGGMGSVYLCEHMQMRHKVAVKVLPTAKAGDPAALGRFYREARAAGVLDHPNLVRAHDIDQDGELHFLVMDYVDGVNLQQLVSRQKSPLSTLRACHYISQAANGLAHAHQAGLVHRDIKPANILLDRQGIIKILDMGLARFFEDTQDLLTLKYDDKNVLGTADYVSPEQAVNSHDVDIRTDIYSLGGAFYFLLAGHPPFPEGKVGQKLLYHQTKEPKPIQEIRPDVPGALAIVISKMMAKDRRKRYQTPEEVVAALEPFAQEAIAPPSEDELPRLSLAARIAGTGDPSTTSGPAPQPAPRVIRPGGSSHIDHRPQTYGSPVAHTWGGRKAAAQAAPPAELSPPNDTPPPAVQAMETVRTPAPVPVVKLKERPAPVSEGDTTLPSPGKNQIVGSRSRLLILLLTLVVGGGGGFVVHLLFGGPSARTQGPDAPPLVVSSKGEPGTYASIAKAVADAAPGAQIQVKADTWQEQLEATSHWPEGIIIVGAAPSGSPVVWSAPKTQKAERPLIHIVGARSLRIQGFTLDGENRIDTLIQVEGHNPHLHLEGIHFQKYRQVGLALVGCQGEPKKPIRCQKSRFSQASSSLASCSLQGTSNAPVAHYHFVENRVEGPAEIGLRITGATKGIVVHNNRFYNLADAIRAGKAGESMPLQLSLRSSTFYEIQNAALYLEDVPDLQQSQIQATRNLFAYTGRIAKLNGFQPRPKSSSAKWIWASGAKASQEEQRYYFRKSFKWTGSKKVILNIACDDAFTVWVNGSRIGHGTFYPHAPKVHAFDVTGVMRSGRNLLAVEGIQREKAPGLLVELSDGKQTVVSDSTWRVTATHESGWQNLPFTDPRWKTTGVVADYGLGSTAWRQPLWEREIQAAFQGRYDEVFLSPSGNVRDTMSREGFPSFASVSAHFQLPVQLNKDKQFLRYSAESTLKELGSPGAK